MSAKIGNRWQQLREKFCDELPPIPARLTRKLPMVPRTLQKFSEITKDPDVPIRKVSELISNDSTLTTMLLKFANSAAVGAPGRISSIQQAIALLGMERLRTAVLSFTLQLAFQSARSQLICPTQFQQDNRERAIFSRCIARRIGGDAELNFVAALLQDLMLPVLTASYAEDYKRARSDEQSLIAFEHQVFGWDHAQMTAALMAKWKFPEELITTVQMHHQFDELLQLSETEGFPLEPLTVAAAGLLPDQLNQNPGGLRKLMLYQDKCIDCSILEIAADVDTELEGEQEPGNRPPLCSRLSSVMTSGLIEDQFRTLLAERRIGRYSLEQEAGKGSMGVVYRARHALLKRPAAIKILDTRRLSDTDVERFETEVQLTSRLTSPHTVTIYDYGMTPEGFFYYIMEYIDGLTLTELVDQLGALDDAAVIRFLLQACDSLAEAHAHKLVHRDIKPENMMVKNHIISGDLLNVLDFGLVATLDPDQTGTGREICGTPMYLAPESILQPDNIDHRVDIYALGAVGYFLLTGRPLFDGPSDDVTTIIDHQLHSTPAAPSQVLERRVDSDLESILLDCLAKSPDQRPQSAVSLAVRLRACQSAPRHEDIGVLPAKDAPPETDEPAESLTPPAAGGSTVIIGR